MSAIKQKGQAYDRYDRAASWPHYPAGVFWVITSIAAFGAFGLLCGDLVEGIIGAPELASIIIGIAVIPYIFARSLQAFVDMARQREVLRLLRKLAEQ